MVTGLTGYPITAGPFSQKIVRLIFNATYSSVTLGKYLIIFSGSGAKKWERQGSGYSTMHDARPRINKGRGAVLVICIWNYKFVSDFDILISDFSSSSILHRVS